MTKKEKFIQAVEDAFFSKIDINEIDQDIIDYWEALKSTKESTKPIITDNGKIILQFLQTHLDKRNYKARDIAEELFISSRTVSGSLRKLVTDGFVEKMGENPTIYSITNKGKEFKID